VNDQTKIRCVAILIGEIEFCLTQTHKIYIDVKIPHAVTN